MRRVYVAEDVALESRVHGNDAQSSDDFWVIGNVLGAEDELALDPGIFPKEFPGAFGTRESGAARPD